MSVPRRPTHVGRGLKCAYHFHRSIRYWSPHACGAWIEVRNTNVAREGGVVAPRMWGVD